MVAVVLTCALARAQALPLAPDPAPAPPAEPAPTVPPAPQPESAPAVVPVVPQNPWRRTSANPAMRLYGASLGVYAGGTLGYVADDDTAIVPLALLLGASGYGLVWGVERLRPDWRPTGRDVGLFYTASGLGAFTGIEAARAIVPIGDPFEYERIAGAGVLGSLLGLGIGLAIQEPPSLQTDLALGLGALAGWQGAAGALGLAGQVTPADRQLLAGAEIGGAAVLAAGSLAYAQAGGALPSAGQIGLDLGHGAWVGAWIPVLARENASIYAVHGMRVGLASGYAVALATAPLGRSSARSVALQGAGIGIGSSLGAGIPLALGWRTDTHPEVVFGPMLAAGVAGQIAGAAASSAFEASADDAALVGLATGWGLYQTVGWSVYAAAQTSDPGQSAGFALTAAGGSTLAGLVVVPFVEWAPAEVAMVGSAGIWGSWSGAWGGALAGSESEVVWASTLIGGNAALLATGAVLATGADCDWGDVAVVNGLGATGAAAGALFGVIASPSTPVIGGSALVGSTAGLITGVVVARRSPPTSAHARLTVSPGRTRWVPRFDSRPWRDPAGQAGVWVALSATEAATPAQMASRDGLD